MLKWLQESLKTGNATVKYPFAPLETVPDTRGKPVHDHIACIACAACATVCPPNAIVMEIDFKSGEYIWRIDYGRCIFCGRCEEVCPLQAIELTSEFELAVFDKADFIETARYRLQECSVCHQAYAPKKEIAYLQDLLDANPAYKEGEASDAREQLEVCPACKRTREAVNVQRIIGEMRKGGADECRTVA